MAPEAGTARCRALDKSFCHRSTANNLAFTLCDRERDGPQFHGTEISLSVVPPEWTEAGRTVTTRRIETTLVDPAGDSD